jgi:hypothetical protein
MHRDLIAEVLEAVGPVAVKALAAVACVLVFAPLLIALIAPLTH